MNTIPENQNGAGLNSASGDDVLAYSMQCVWARRRLIFGLVVFATIISIVIALLLPRYFAGEVRVLQPEHDASTGLLGLLSGPVGGFRTILGGPRGEYSRYLAILDSRSARLQLIEEFELVSVYDQEHESHPLESTLLKLDKNLSVQIDPELGYLSVIAYDRDPERAAAMANFMVDILNREHARLTSEGARQTRLFVENRLNEARLDLDSARVRLQEFQERYGLIELESQAQVYVAAMADERSRLAQLEVTHFTLAAQYGPDHPRVQAAHAALSATRRQLGLAIGGGDQLLPLALREMPAVTREYAELRQELMIQAQVIETLYPVFEQSRFQEQREALAVQVLDRATPPVLPARPSRRFIVVISVLSTFMLATLFAVADGWVRRKHHVLAATVRRVTQAI